MAKGKGKKKDKEEHAPSVRNKKARFQYNLLETLEAGVSLLGTEVKSLRQGQASLTESYATIRSGEIFLLDANIPPYENGTHANHEPTRPRKLLLHRREINHLTRKVQQKGLTLVPVSIYFARGKAKVQIALAEGKQLHDKRDKIKKRETKREIDREMVRQRKR